MGEMAEVLSLQHGRGWSGAQLGSPRHEPSAKGEAKMSLKPTGRKPQCVHGGRQCCAAGDTALANET